MFLAGIPFLIAMISAMIWVSRNSPAPFAPFRLLGIFIAIGVVSFGFDDHRNLRLLQDVESDRGRRVVQLAMFEDATVALTDVSLRMRLARAHRTGLLDSLLVHHPPLRLAAFDMLAHERRMEKRLFDLNCGPPRGGLQERAKRP